MIGIVGGVGPLAGLDLQAKIISQTAAGRDQEHLPVLSLSWPGPIVDRTEYLLGQVAANPAHALLSQLRLLAAAGATVAAIPCNTAHAPAIFDIVRAGVAGSPLRLLHMIAETAAHLAAEHPELRRSASSRRRAHGARGSIRSCWSRAGCASSSPTRPCKRRSTPPSMTRPTALSRPGGRRRGRGPAWSGASPRCKPPGPRPPFSAARRCRWLSRNGAMTACR